MGNKQVAMTIIRQMGGMSKLRAMVRAKDFVALESGVQFGFKGNRKMNKCVIKLNGMDLYDVEFWNIRITSKTFKTDMVAEFNDCFNDMLINIFESTTGLYLSL
jgi:hypothetical protein